MGTKNYNNYSDMITFTRASSGTALAKISYGPELVTNGTFDTDTSGWTIVNFGSGTTGVWNAGGYIDLPRINGSNFSYAHQTITTTTGNWYQIQAQSIAQLITLRVGTVPLGSTILNQGGLSGSVTFLFQATGASAVLSIYGSSDGTTASIDNISIKELLFDQPDGTLQLFNHPANQPRVEYDYQGNRLGLLVEEARTNRLPYSNDLTTWIKSAVSYSQNADGPLGIGTATTITATAGSGSHWYYQGTGSNSVDQCDSLFAKAGTVGFVCISSAGPSADGVWFDLSNGQVGTANGSSSGTIEYWGDGWYRCAAVIPTATYVTVHPCIQDGQLQNFVADGTETILVCGHQAELGSFPTSYIPTSGATATRSADVASIGVGAFGYNAQGGTVVVTADWYPGSNFLVSNRAALEIGDGGVSERLLIYNHDGFAGRGFMKGVLFGDQTGSGARITDDQAKVALVFADANQAHCVDGGSIDTGSAAMLAGTTIMKIGPTLRTGHISSIAYYPRRLTDAQIKALTSPPETPTLSLTFDDSSTSYLETSIHG